MRDGFVKISGYSTSMNKKRILLIEDNTDIANLSRLHLADLDCDIDHAANGIEGLRMAEGGHYDLLILDLMLPGLEGTEICRRLRAQNNYVPILMLTSKSSELDRVLGLEVGADDYLTKPFSVRELLARVKALFRRIDVFSRPQQQTQTLQLGDMYIDMDKHLVQVERRNIDLTAKEFELLMQFAQHPGRVYSRTQLLDLVWGYGHDGYEHTVNSHINRLRAKIESDPAHPDYILTVWGVGYKFNDQLVALSA